MYIISKSWLAHKDDRDHPLSILSINVSPDNKRIATGGLDGKIRIWSLEAALSTESKTPKQLCSMSTHTGTVTAVRFSPNGKYLASGSDDRFLIIWTYNENRIKESVLGSKEVNFESWKSLRRLTGHDNDIQDISWSFDSKLLISVGLDSAIIVWSGSTFERLKTLTAHKSHVKGVTFDPANKYFATQSDDRTMKIWRQSDLLLDQTITLPFDHSPLTTYFRRPSWSPDGAYIAAANSMNGPVSSVCMVERGTWESNVSLIGHEGPVEACAFNPKLFKGPGNDQNGASIATVLACAGSDRKLSIWFTGCSRPLLVVSDIANKGIGDLCWTLDGKTLLLCSYDGTVKACIFEDGDFEPILGDEESFKALTKYGFGVQNTIPAETVEQSELEESASNNKSNLVEKLNKPYKEVVVQDIPISCIKAQDIEKDILPVVQQQTVSLTKDGRKRVTPMLVQTEETTKGNTASQFDDMNEESIENSYANPSNSLPLGGLKTLLIGNKRRAYTYEESQEIAKRRSQNISKPQYQFLRNAILNPSIQLAQVRLSVPNVKSSIEFSACQDVNESFHILEIKNSADQNPSKISVSAAGRVIWTDFVPRSVLLVSGTEYFWVVACEDGTIILYSTCGRRLRAPLTLESIASRIDCSGKYLMVITIVGMVHCWNVWEKTACHPPVSLAPVLDSAIIGISDPKAAPTITMASVNLTGKILIGLDDGESFIYDSKMYCWEKISEIFWAVASHYWDSTGMRLPDSLIGGIIGKAERNTNREVMNIGRGKFMQKIVKGALFKEGFENFESITSISHLETRLAVAEVLQVEEEYKYLLGVYCERLAEEGNKDKIDQILSCLLGPISLTTNGDNQQACFGKNHELLRQILFQISKYRDVQRVTNQYLEMLKKLI